MPRPSPDAIALGGHYQLALDDSPPRGPSGEHLGRGTGASLEFQDRRAYTAGDDVRHLDWRAFARTDQLLVRQWREEVLRRVELLVDGSRSMAIDPAKAQLTVDLVALLAHAALEHDSSPHVVLLDERPRKVEIDELESRGLEFEGRAQLSEALRAAGGLQRAGSMVVLVSDFLVPHEAADLVRPLAARAGALALVQVLAQSERQPLAGTAQRLIDCETDEALDLVLDAATVARYGERLQRLTSALERETRRAGGRFVPIATDRELDAIARDDLARQGVLAPR